MSVCFSRSGGVNVDAGALFGGKTASGSTIAAALPMLWVSLVSALVIAIGKIAISLLSAFAIVYFRFPLRNLVFWLIFVTLMLPVEVRIFPTYKVISDLGMLNSYAGLTIPLTFYFQKSGQVTLPQVPIGAPADSSS